MYDVCIVIYCNLSISDVVITLRAAFFTPNFLTDGGDKIFANLITWQPTVVGASEGKLVERIIQMLFLKHRKKTTSNRKLSCFGEK